MGHLDLEVVRIRFQRGDPQINCFTFSIILNALEKRWMCVRFIETTGSVHSPIQLSDDECLTYPSSRGGIRCGCSQEHQ